MMHSLFPSRSRLINKEINFFLQVFHLVNVRLLDLAHKLNLSDDLRRKTWTCIEYSLTKHVDLMRDRHLDQVIMSAIYLMCKVCWRTTAQGWEISDFYKNSALLFVCLVKRKAIIFFFRNRLTQFTWCHYHNNLGCVKCKRVWHASWPSMTHLCAQTLNLHVQNVKMCAGQV